VTPKKFEGYAGAVTGDYDIFLPCVRLWNKSASQKMTLLYTIYIFEHQIENQSFYFTKMSKNTARLLKCDTITCFNILKLMNTYVCKEYI